MWCCAELPANLRPHLLPLQECLGAFTELETLAAEDGYNCTTCRRQGVCATKRLTVYRLPPVLMIHLKRFSANSGSGLLGRFSALSKVEIDLERSVTRPGASQGDRSGRPALLSE